MITPARFPRPIRRTLLAALALSAALGTARAQSNRNPENVDHAGIISRWDGESLERGRKLFSIACAPCHGTNGVQTINPQARPFAVEKFQNGRDPFSLFKTITRGFKNMPAQTWMKPEQRYEVIQYIRETFVRPLNPSQYQVVDPAYLASLPKYDPTLPAPAATALARERDFGPALESQLDSRFSDALTVRLPDQITISYDVHHLRSAGVWRGGYLDLSRTGHYQQRGEGQPMRKGELVRGLQAWEWAYHGTFDYPTNDLAPRGPLPGSWMKYEGHYVYNRQAVLSYRIEGRHVLEVPDAEWTNQLAVLSHTLRVEPGTNGMRLCVARAESPREGGAGFVLPGKVELVRGNSSPASGHLAMVSDGLPGASDSIGAWVAAGIAGGAGDLAWQVDDHGRVILEIPPGDQPRVARVLRASGRGTDELRRFSQRVKQAAREELVDPSSMTHGGARLWPFEPVVRGTLGQPKGGYALDTVALPDDNPYGAWLRTSALAFFPDGRAVVTTYGGDVWIVSGLDQGLEHPVWSRFAAGLYEPFGAQVVDNEIYVTCRNGIVRLRDLNQDGEADFYETWYADTDVSRFFHSFNFDLQVDARRHFYYVKAGEYTDYKLPGAVLDISPGGADATVYCTGFRVPNGMGMLPDGRLTVSDNQGDWMPASKINLIHPGGFYGYVQTRQGGGSFGDQWAPDGGRIDPRKVAIPQTFDQPIIWMPQEFDNSSSAQLWVEDRRFGPLAGRLLHTSFGKGWMYYLTMQEVGPVTQSAIVALPFQFDAGLMRARCNPADGQVYAVGLSGWQGPADGKDGCLQRLRYTGATARLLDDCQVRTNGLALRFNFPLARRAAGDPASYHLEQWNYLWSHNYGSDQYSLEHPGQKGHDLLPVRSATIDPDGRGVFLQTDPLSPVNQVELKFNLAAEDGTPWQELVYLTINAVPGQ